MYTLCILNEMQIYVVYVGTVHLIKMKCVGWTCTMNYNDIRTHCNCIFNYNEMYVYMYRTCRMNYNEMHTLNLHIELQRNVYAIYRICTLRYASNYSGL